MPLHIRHELAIEVKHLGVMAIVGKHEETGWSTDPNEGIDLFTDVSFIIQFHREAPLAPYLDNLEHNCEFINSIIKNTYMESVTEQGVFLAPFTVTVKGKLREPNKFLHATADKLLKELKVLEEEELTFAEESEEHDWFVEHHDEYMRGIEAPKFKRPRHVD